MGAVAVYVVMVVVLVAAIGDILNYLFFVGTVNVVV